MSLSVRS